MSSESINTDTILEPLFKSRSALNALGLSFILVGVVITFGALSAALSTLYGPQINGVEYLKVFIYDPMFGILVLVSGVLMLRAIKKVVAAIETKETIHTVSAIKYMTAGACVMSVALLLVSLFTFIEMWMTTLVSVCIK